MPESPVLPVFPVTLPVFESPFGQLYQGDCLTLLPSVVSGSVDLVFADPPFNLGKDYGAGVADSRPDAGYLEWCAQWISECVRVLAPGGSLFLYNLPRWNVSLAALLLQSGLTFRHWIAVDMKMSLPIPGRLYPAHYSLLYFTNGRPKSFVRPRLPVQICRHCGGDVKDYGGHRNKLHPDGINLSDVWTDLTPVRHRGRKTRAANELSPRLLRRVIEMASVPGDLVLDPFGGSGTTFAVAEELHRHWWGAELGDVTPIVRRLQGLPPQEWAVNLGDCGRH